MSELLDRPTLVRQALAFDVPPASVELLGAIDRGLRQLSTSGALDAEASAGWALGGSAALHGVYLRSHDLLRVPEELCFAPIGGRQQSDAAVIVDSVASVMPRSSARQESDALWLITYRSALEGETVLPVRFERSPLRMEPSKLTEGAVRAASGYLYDPRMGYHSRVAETPIPVPVAYVEELLLRLCVALVSAGRDDYPLRVDDMRLALDLEYGDTRAMLGTAVRDNLISGLRAKGTNDAATMRRQLQAIVDRLKRVIESHDDPVALPTGLRPARATYDRRDFEIGLDKALSVLVSG